jgi:hypothetical protein
VSFRIEDKLLIDPQRLGDLYNWIESRSGYTLFEKRLVFSTYFENQAKTMFLDSEEGTLPRKKIRIRSYGTTSHANVKRSLEIKISSIEGRFKTARELQDSELNEFMNMGYFDEQYGMCVPISCVAYMREYFSVAGVRLTVDQDIRYRPAASQIWTDDPAIAVEIKAPYGSPFDYLEQNFPFRRVRFSKYARAINAALNMSDAWI